jgi:DNA polymerase-3 subunit delta
MPEFTCMALVAVLESRDFKKKILEKYDIPGKNIVDFSSLRDSDIMDWAKAYTAKDKKEIDYEVMDYIIYESNGDMAFIKNEIDKLVLFTRDKTGITVEDFNKTRGVEKGFSIFDFSDAIGEANEKKALTILEKIYEDEAPEQILGFVFSSIYKIYILKYYMGKSGFLTKQAEQEASKFMNWYTMKKAKDHVKNFLRIPFIDILRIIKEADKKIKLSSKENGKIIFQIMLEKIFLKLSETKN